MLVGTVEEELLAKVEDELLVVGDAREIADDVPAEGFVENGDLVGNNEVEFGVIMLDVGEFRLEELKLEENVIDPSNGKIEVVTVTATAVTVKVSVSADMVTVVAFTMVMVPRSLIDLVQALPEVEVVAEDTAEEGAEDEAAKVEETVVPECGVTVRSCVTVRVY